MNVDESIARMIKSKPEGRHRIGDRLYLRIHATGCASYLYRCSFKGERLWVTLKGKPPYTHRDAALSLVGYLNDMVSKGKDPREAMQEFDYTSLTKIIGDRHVV